MARQSVLLPRITWPQAGATALKPLQSLPKQTLKILNEILVRLTAAGTVSNNASHVVSSLVSLF